MPESVPSFAIEFACILLPVAKQGDGWIVCQLNDFLTYTFFETNIGKQYIKGLADCKYVTTRNICELIRNDQFLRVRMTVGNAQKDGCGTKYMKDMTDILQRQVKFS